MHGFTIIRKDSEAVIIYKPSLPWPVSSTQFIYIQKHVHKRPTGYLLDDAILLLHQNASVFCFLVQIRPSAVLILAGISTFKYEKKHQMYLGFTI